MQSLTKENLENISESLPLRTLAMAALIFLVVSFLHAHSRIITSYDSRWFLLTAQSILREGNLNLDEYERDLKAEHYYCIHEVGGHKYNLFPFGNALLALPFVWALDQAPELTISLLPGVKLGNRERAAIDRSGGDYLASPSLRRALERTIASLVIGLCAALIFLLGCQKLSITLSLAVTFLFAFCTSAWSIASRALWQHGPTMLMLLIALHFILAARKYPRLIVFAGVPLALAYVIRPSNSISCIVFSVFVALRYRKFLLEFVGGAALVAFPYFLVNYYTFGSVLSPYEGPGRLGTIFNFEALSGNLISPARGLFVFSPFLIYSVWGYFIQIRAEKSHLLSASLLLIILLHWLLVSSFSPWFGGHSFGPRFMSDLLPYFFYFLIPAVDHLQKSWVEGRKLLGIFGLCALASISFYIHYRGATASGPVQWNVSPIPVNDAPERMWDFRDLQFLR